MQFKEGQTVKHKSSNFKMIIIKVEDGFQPPNPIMITCRYWDKKEEKFTTKQFYPFELELVEE